MPFRLPAAILAFVVTFMPVARPVAADRAWLPPFLGTSELYVADWRTGLALDGADPVAYFADGALRQGRDGIDTIWRGLAWRFATEANRTAFIGDPDSFAPRLGGYDAAMAARGIVVAGDPSLFAIASGRLYLFRSAANRQAFTADASVASRAEQAWPGLRATLAQD